MSEDKEKVTVYDNGNNNGVVTYAADVIASIAGIAAIEIEGVAGMSGGISSGIAELLGKKNLTKGVKVEIGTEETAIDLNIVVEYGCNIQNVAKSIQENVKKNVETMTGLTAVEININIQGVNVKKEETAEGKLK